MALSSSALIDTTFFNLMSGLSIVEGSDDEDKLFAIINSITEMMEDICGRRLKARSYSYIAGANYDQQYAIFDPPGPSGNTIFWFPTYPVNSLTTFIVSDTTITAAEDYDSTTGYFLYKETGKLVYSYGFDYGYIQNIKTVWNGGYASDHKKYPELQHLAFLFTKKVWDESGDSKDDLISESIGNYKYTRANPKDLSKFFGVPSFVFHNLFRFKRFSIA